VGFYDDAFLNHTNHCEVTLYCFDNYVFDTGIFYNIVLVYTMLWHGYL